MTYRIWIDQDSVLYDLHTPWLKAHARDFPAHTMTIEDHAAWDVQQVCRDAGCGADMRSYFNLPELWSDGLPIEHSQNIVYDWTRLPNTKLGVLTTAANGLCMPYKLEWLRKFFPHIRDVIMVNNHLKHLVQGDILIDDGLHNLEHWPGVGICFTQPWNKSADVLRADNWLVVDTLVHRTLSLLDSGVAHKDVERMLKEERS